MDLTDSIAPNSDQLNADDLMAGPRTVTITEVRAGSDEQPVNVVLDEYGSKRPFRPSKSMRRVLVAAWGKESSAYVGKRMTIYRDPAVRFGGQEVGGIRISHMSGLDKPLRVALTVTRGKREGYIVQPLAEAAQQAARGDRVTSEQTREIVAGFDTVGITDRAERLSYCEVVVGHKLTSAGDLTRTEASAVITALQDAASDPESKPDEDGVIA